VAAYWLPEICLQSALAVDSVKFGCTVNTTENSPKHHFKSSNFWARIQLRTQALLLVKEALFVWHFIIGITQFYLLPKRLSTNRMSNTSFTLQHHRTLPGTRFLSRWR